MAVSPAPLEQKLRANREAPRTEPVDLAAQITEWYHNEVMSKNTELAYQNPPAQVNRGAFYSALAPAYVDVETPMKSPNPAQVDIISNAHRAAAIAYWSGATMQRIKPPPPAESIVEHPINNPGSLSLNLPKINTIPGYAGMVADAHTQHLLTVQGTAVSRMPDGSIQNFPWTGIG